MKEKIIEVAVIYIVPLLLAGLAALLGWVGRSLKQKFEADGKLTLLERVALKVINLSEMVVRDVETTTKRSLESMKEGGLTADEYRALRAEAVSKLKSSLGEHGLAELRSVLGLTSDVAVDTYLGGVVERAVTVVSTQKAAKEAPDAPFAKLPGGLPPGQ